MSFNSDHARELLERIIANPKSPDIGILENDLLTEFHRGYPVENLSPLLLNENQDIATIGAWIASELGERGKPLLDHVLSLLSHPARKVRFSTIDCILLWATPSRAIELASVILLMADQELGVRWKVLDFLSRASPQQLQAALSYIKVAQPGSRHVAGLEWLLGPDAIDPQAVTASLRSSDPVLRKYGVVAAARLSRDNREPLLYAQSVDDPEVKAFADSMIGQL